MLAILGSSFVSGLQSERVAATAKEVRFPAGITIFTDEQPATGCWLLRSGQVALGTEVPGRGLVVVQTLAPGELLGWSWLVPPYHWHFTATAVYEVNAVEFDAATSENGRA